MAALEVLQQVAKGAYSDDALHRVFSKYSLGKLDKSLVTELSYGAIRQRYFLDCCIDAFAKVKALKQPPLLRWVLHIGLYQLLKMERIPPSAAINTSVELAKVINLSGLSPVINAILRSALRAKDSGEVFPLSKDFALRLAQVESFPLWLVEELINWREKKGAQFFLQASNKVPSLDLRVNTLRINLQELKDLFHKSDIQAVCIEGCPDGLEIISGEGDLRQWPGYNEGFWFVQDRSSQWVAPLLQPQPGELILDACSAPGGKTTHLAALMGNQGEIWAVDFSSERLKRLAENTERLGCKCVKSVRADACLLSHQDSSLKSSFDRILLDAPCSGLGTLARNPDARWRISVEKITQIVALQNKLLEGVLPLLKPGGCLVYSTCTIHPDENINLIDKFINKHPELTLVMEKQIWPEPVKSGDGFYAAVIKLR